MAKSFKLTVQTAEGILLEGDAEYCRLPTAEGSLGVLAFHAPMLCALTKGTLFFRMEDGTEKTVAVSGGVANVRYNTVTILSDRAKLVETLSP